MERKIEKTDSFSETKNKKDIFLNLEEKFPSLQNKDNISKKFFDKQIKEFQEKT
jgi:hypothetical protein